MNNSAGFMDDLGPMAAIWQGRNQVLGENRDLINQEQTLEQIATAQQNRDITAKKLPFELGQLQHQQQMNPLLIKQQDTKNKTDLQKFDKEQFGNFWDDFRKTAPALSGTPADVAILTDLATKHGMDPNDPRIRRMIGVASSGNPQAMQEMIKKIDSMAPSVGERVAQEEAVAKIKADPKNVSADVKYRTDAEERMRADDRKAKLAIAEAKAKSGDNHKKNKNFEQAATEYYEAAQNAYAGGLTAQGDRLMQQAIEMRDLALRAKAEGRNVPQAGEPTVAVGADGNRRIEPRPAQPTPPMTNSSGAGGAPRAFNPQTLQGEDKQAYDWAKDNPADPRSAAILKRLGAQ